MGENLELLTHGRSLVHDEHATGHPENPSTIACLYDGPETLTPTFKIPTHKP